MVAAAAAVDECARKEAVLLRHIGRNALVLGGHGWRSPPTSGDLRALRAPGADAEVKLGLGHSVN